MDSAFDRLATALADRYTLERELGRGGMATVYLAVDRKHGRQVAIKVLHPELAATLGVDRFVREIEIAANLTHPHILPLFDSDEAGGFLYYVMPYVEGESLRERLGREVKLSVQEAIRITNQTAGALTYAHERGVIHRDVKPENILLAGDQAIVADFGIARAVELAGGERLTGTGLAIGTPAYMSPEQAFSSGEVDATTDVYALGCVVYEMLTARTPFEGATPQALLAKHAVDTVPGLRTNHPDIPVLVERAVERALCKEPAARFRTATEFAEALSDATTPEARAAEEQRAAWRRWTRGLAAAGTVAVLALGGWWLTGQVTAQPIEDLAVLPASNMTRNAEHDYFVDGVHEALVIELQRAGLPVIARQSVLQYRETDKPIRQIAQELGVDALIQLAVGREGDSVVVDVALYAARSQLPLWTQSFPAEVQGVLGLYRAISGRIAKEVGTALSAQAETRLAERPTVDPRVYEAYLKGQFHWYQLTAAGFDRALEYFELAIERSPVYAPAYAGISRVWIGRLQIGAIPPNEAAPRATAAALKAVELDSTLAEARYALALVKTWSDWDWEGGEAEFRRAIELNPSYADAHAHYSHLLFIMRRPEEGLAQIERALELDPFNALFHGLYGLGLLFVGRYDEAIERLNTTPRHPLARFGLAAAYEAKGDHSEALRHHLEAASDTALAGTLARGYEEGGYTEAARRAAQLLLARSRTSYVPPTAIAAAYLKAGDQDRALESLERGFEARDPNMRYIGIHPNFHGLHGEPRFQDLLLRMNLPR